MHTWLHRIFAATQLTIPSTLRGVEMYHRSLFYMLMTCYSQVLMMLIFQVSLLICRGFFTNKILDNCTSIWTLSFGIVRMALLCYRLGGLIVCRHSISSAFKAHFKNPLYVKKLWIKHTLFLFNLWIPPLNGTLLYVKNV